MVEFEHLQRLMEEIPNVEFAPGKQDSFGYTVKGKFKGIAWQWMERIDPKKPRVVNPTVWAFRTPNLEIKEAILASDDGSGKFFTEPHYARYPAVLARLDRLTMDDLKDLVATAASTVA